MSLTINPTGPRLAPPTGRWTANIASVSSPYENPFKDLSDSALAEWARINVDTLTLRAMRSCHLDPTRLPASHAMSSCPPCCSSGTSEARRVARGERRDELADRLGDPGLALASYMGRRCTGITLRALGEAAGRMGYTVERMALKRFEQRLAAESKLQRLARRRAPLLPLVGNRPRNRPKTPKAWSLTHQTTLG